MVRHHADGSETKGDVIAEKVLLVSDLDDTFLGDPEALKRFCEFYPSVENRVEIVYASGRFYESIREDIETTHLPAPVGVIGGVGSEIRCYPEGRLNQSWVDRISGRWSAERIKQILSDEEALELQPDECQSEFKVSYYITGASQHQLDRLRARLFDEGINVSLIYSSDRDLDILPEGVNKGTAAAFVAKELGYSRDRVIVAGNSGNDAKLFEHGFYGIIVANAHEELKAFADDPRHFLSSGERADGVRIGLQHWLKEVTDDQQ